MCDLRACMCVCVGERVSVLSGIPHHHQKELFDLCSGSNREPKSEEVVLPLSFSFCLSLVSICNKRQGSGGRGHFNVCVFEFG